MLRKILPASFLLLTLTLVVHANDEAKKQCSPRCGAQKSIPAITIALNVGSTGKEVKRVTYAPPPGWYVRSHRVEVRERTGLTSFTINTVPRDWSYLSEEQVKETYRGLLDLAAKAQNFALGAKLAAEEEKTLAEVRKARASHHALIVEATVKGEGLFRTAGVLYLTVVADLVYVGTPEDLVRETREQK